MQIINAVHKAVVDNGLESIKALITFCGISYAGALAILNNSGDAKLCEVIKVLNYVGLSLRVEKVGV